MKHPGEKVAIAVVLALAAIATAGSQELATWFDRAPEAAPYLRLKPETIDLASKLRKAGLTDTLLKDKIMEASVKHVTPERLLPALEQETARLVELSALLTQHSLLPASPDEAGILAAEASLLIRAGLALHELDMALGTTAAKRETRGENAFTRAKRAFSALGSVLAVDRRFSIPEKERLDLTAVLIQSDLAPERYDSLLSVFARGRAIGLSTSRIALVCIEILGSGGSIDRIERELQRRSSSP